MLNEKILKLSLTRLFRNGVNKNVIQNLYKFLFSNDAQDLFNLKTHELQQALNISRNEFLDLIIKANRENLFRISWLVFCPDCNALIKKSHSTEIFNENFFCDYCQNNFEIYIDENLKALAGLHPEVFENDDSYKTQLFKPMSSLQYINGYEIISRPIYGSILEDFQNPLSIKNITLLFIVIEFEDEVGIKSKERILFSEFKRHLNQLNEIITEFEGSFVNILGNKLLATFTSPVNALTSAIAIKQKLQNNKILVKIGLNCGSIYIYNYIENSGYFGSTLEFASKIMQYSDESTISASQSIIENQNVLSFLHNNDLSYSLQEKIKNAPENKNQVYSIFV